MGSFREKLNVGFVGCGRIADLHVPGYRDSSDARLYAICDTNPDILRQRQTQWNVEKTYARFEDMLADPKLDAVEILTPQPLHESQTIAAAKAGKHIALQKPMSVDLASCDRIAREVKRANVVFKVTENYVFYPPLVRARELIQEGAIGDPVTLRIQFVSGPEGGWDVPGEAWEWRMKEARAGRGPSTFDHGHHLWSTAWFLLGESERVSGWIDSLDGIIDCPSHFMWKYKEGTRYGSCQFVHCEHLRVPSKYYANDEWIEVFGTRGILKIRRCTGNLQDGPALLLYDGTGWKEIPGLDSDWGAGFVGATRDFVSAIRQGSTPMLNLEQARYIMKFALALQEAARQRTEVYLEDLDARFPRLNRQQREWKSRIDYVRRLDWLEELGLAKGTRAYAPQAVPLTRALVQEFKSPTPPLADASIGLILKGDDLPTMELGFLIQNNQAQLLEGQLPVDPRLTVTMAPGLWAAILLKKKRIDMAVIQGKISFTGQVDEALKLKGVFGF